MRTYMKIKFPCGYEIEAGGSSFFGGSIRFDTEDLPECPLHGRKCKRK